MLNNCNFVVKVQNSDNCDIGWYIGEDTVVKTVSLACRFTYQQAMNWQKKHICGYKFTAVKV